MSSSEVEGRDLEAEEAASVPWYRDRTLQVGLSIPLLILLGFFAYLGWQGYQSHERARLIRLKTEADHLADGGKSEQAYEKYQELIKQAGKTEDAELRSKVREAEAAVVSLVPTIERIRAEREAREKQEALARAEEEARREDERKLQQREAELARIRGSIVGGSWVTKKLGNSDIIRGMDVYLIPQKVRRSSIDGWLDRFWRTRGELRGLSIFIAQIHTAKGDEYVSVKPLLSDARSSRDGYSHLVEDDLWPAIVLSNKVASAVTDIDGKFEFSDVKGGDYYLFACHASEYSYIDWLVPVTVSESGHVKQDLYNQTARLIYNKKDYD